MPTNEERASRAYHALAAYKHDGLSECGPVGEDDIVDFLTDLHHYNNGHFDLLANMATAAGHYEAEKTNAEV